MRHFASATFPFSDEHKYMLMLSAYMDETGHSRDEKQRFNGMAGLIAPAANWEVFERKWKATLTSKEFDIPYFHMKDFAHYKGDFTGWSEAKRQKLFGKLIRHIEVANPLPIGTIIPMEEFRALTAVLHGEFNDPYFLSFLGIIASATTFMDVMEAPAQEKVALIFSDQVEFKNRALRLYDAIREDIGARHIKRSTPPDFRDMRDFMALQAADIVAYELYKEYERLRYRPEDAPRFGYQRITRMSTRLGYKPSFDFYTKAKLADYAGLSQRVAKRQKYWEKKRANS